MKISSVRFGIGRRAKHRIEMLIEFRLIALPESSVERFSKLQETLFLRTEGFGLTLEVERSTARI